MGLNVWRRARCEAGCEDRDRGPHDAAAVRRPLVPSQPRLPLHRHGTVTATESRGVSRQVAAATRGTTQNAERDRDSVASETPLRRPNMLNTQTATPTSHADHRLMPPIMPRLLRLSGPSALKLPGDTDPYRSRVPTHAATHEDLAGSTICPGTCVGLDHRNNTYARSTRCREPFFPGPQIRSEPSRSVAVLGELVEYAATAPPRPGLQHSQLQLPTSRRALRPVRWTPQY
jgi:hypothetical protein